MSISSANFSTKMNQLKQLKFEDGELTKLLLTSNVATSSPTKLGVYVRLDWTSMQGNYK